MMDKFVPSIKEKYHNRRINREKQWPPCQSSKLINLELVEKIQASNKGSCARGKKHVKRTPLCYRDLFTVYGVERRSVKRILLEGDAGIGKTTFSIAVSEDWANGKLFQQFELLLLLPLRHRKVSTAHSLPELLKLLHSSQTLCDTVANQLEESEGSNVLIIADGWDELSESQQSEGSVLYELLFEDFLPFASVIVTSRPSASARFHTLPCIDQFVELIGFDKENIASYIQSEFPADQEKADRLREQLEHNTLVESLCRIPLNCAIICHLWRTLEEDLPSTMTELYTKIICNIVLRNIQKNGFGKVQNLSNFEALPDDLKPAWRLMCKLAFEALKQDQITFMQEELEEFFPESAEFQKKLLCFGLLQSSHSMLEDGCGVSIHFLHLTIQEYLAALHLVSQLPNNEAETMNQPVVQCKLVEKGHFDIVWRFFFGTFFNVVKRLDSHVIIPFIAYSHGCPLVANNRVVQCHCALESKNEEVDASVIQSLQSGRRRLRFSFESTSAQDTDAVIYVLDKIKECTDTYISLENCKIREDQLRRLTNALASKYGKVNVTFLTLTGGSLGNKGTFCLFNRAPDAFQSLLMLNLSGNNIGAKKNIPILPINLTLTEVTKLNLSNNPLGVSGVQMLQDAVKRGSFNKLVELILKNCLTENANTNAIILDSLFETLFSVCSPTREIDLSQNNLSVPGALVIAKFESQLDKISHMDIHKDHNYWRNTLRLNECNFNDESLCTFIKTLECSQTKFHTLCLSANNIHSTGIQCLADAVCSGRVLFQGFCSQLCLQDNQLGLNGTAAISKMLKHGCKVYELHLSRCQLTTVESDIPISENKQNMTSELLREWLCLGHQNETIQRLCLDGNNFNGDGIHILIGFICLCPNLRELSCMNCEINSDDFTQLLDGLNQFKMSSPGVCSRLGRWYLYGNKIGDDGISTLMSHQLPSLFPQMTGASNERYGCGFLLGENPASNDMIAVLSEEVKKQKCYRVNLIVMQLKRIEQFKKMMAEGEMEKLQRQRVSLYNK